mgnify:CR=1 FL=1
MSKLEDYIVQIRGVSYKPTDSSESEIDGYVPLLRSNNIKDGKINYDNLIYVKEEKVKENQFLKKGDILICTSNGSKELVGKAGLIKEDIRASFGAFCRVIRIKKSLNYQYLIHFFHSNYYKENIKKKSNGANINNLKNEDVDSLDINVIKSKKQLEIANELDKIVDIINIKENQISKLDELIKAQFIEMFENKKYSKIKLGDEFDVSSGGTPSKKEKEYWNSNDISWIGSNMCQNKIIYENDGKYISYLGLEHSSAKIYPINTILVALVGATIGKTALLKFETTTNQNIAGIQISNRFNAEYVYFAIQNLYYKFIELGNGGFKMANLSFIKNLEISMPPIELQNKFAEFVTKIDKQKAICNKTIDELNELKESKMQEYFGGVVNE